MVMVDSLEKNYKKVKSWKEKYSKENISTFCTKQLLTSHWATHLKFTKYIYIPTTDPMRVTGPGLVLDRTALDISWRENGPKQHHPEPSACLCPQN